MEKPKIDHNAEYEKAINRFGTRITNLASQHNANSQRQVELIWPLSRLLAEIKAFTPSTKALKRVREERFPFISSGDLSRYIYIGQNLDTVKKWYKENNLTLASAQRIASTHKKHIKDAESKAKSIEQYKADAGRTADIASAGSAEYLKRLKSKTVKAPTIKESTYNGRCIEACNALYNLVDTFSKLNNEKPLTTNVVNAINEEIETLMDIINNEEEKAA